MKLTQEDMCRLARLSGLEPEAAEPLNGRLEALLSCMRTLDGIDPAQPERTDGENVLRADASASGMDRERLLANAPRQDGAYILVPRTVGEVDG